MASIDKVRKIAVGDSGVGKSSLINLVCQNEPIIGPSWTVGCFVDAKLDEYKEGLLQPKTLFVELRDIGGKIAASCAHASITCYSQTLRRNPLLAIDWERSGQKKIILRFTDGEVGLRRIFQQAKQQKVCAALIRDAGKTQVPPGTVTALGIGPASADQVAKILPDLKLL